MFEKILLFSVCICGLITVGLVISKFLHMKLDVYHPLVILFSVSAIDVYIPGLIWAVEGIPPQPSWVPVFTLQDVTAGVLVYLLSYMGILIGYWAARGSTPATPASQRYELNKSNFRLLVLLLLILSISQIVYAMISAGSPAAWFAQKIMVRWSGGLDAENGPTFFELLPIRIAFSMLVIVGFYYRYELNRSILFGWVLPFIALLMAAATFFRGSILVFLLGLLFVERLRVYTWNSSFNERVSMIGWRPIDKTLLKWISFAFCLFFIYGVARDSLSQESWGDSADNSVAASALSRGDGLVGVTSIVKYFDTPKDILAGKTYMDMLLLPVPRFIYTSKPQWYGIDDITRSMGWAESTQSAVTMPGEAYANFWIFSLFFMPLLGVLFAYIARFAASGSPFGSFMYPSVLLYVVINSNWMAFTGMANQLLPIMLCAITLVAVFKKQAR
jgi:uncharacterized membrane protein